MIKKLFAWIKRLFKKPTYLKNAVKHPAEIKPYIPTTARGRSRIKKTDTPSTRFDKRYSRLYDRYQLHKTRVQRQNLLRTKGLKDVINKDGSVSTVVAQPPYRNDKYKTLNDYNSFVRGFSYHNMNK